MRKAGETNVMFGGFAFEHAEPNRGRRAHLDRGNTTFRVALSEVAVTRRVEGTIDVDRNQQPRSLG